MSGGIIELEDWRGCRVFVFSLLPRAGISTRDLCELCWNAFGEGVPCLTRETLQFQSAYDPL